MDRNGQPAPGLTTELPHHWSVDLDDGTGGGEDSPMQTTEIKGGLFLRPENNATVKDCRGKRWYYYYTTAKR